MKLTKNGLHEFICICIFYVDLFALTIFFAIIPLHFKISIFQMDRAVSGVCLFYPFLQFCFSCSIVLFVLKFQLELDLSSFLFLRILSVFSCFQNSKNKISIIMQSAVTLHSLKQCESKRFCTVKTV